MRIGGIHSPGLHTCGPRDLLPVAARQMAFAEVGALAVVETSEHSSAVARRMLDAGVRHLPVTERGRLVGMVSTRDLLTVETWL